MWCLETVARTFNGECALNMQWCEHYYGTELKAPSTAFDAIRHESYTRIGQRSICMSSSQAFKNACVLPRMQPMRIHVPASNRSVHAYLASLLIEQPHERLHGVLVVQVHAICIVRVVFNRPQTVLLESCHLQAGCRNC